MGKDALHLGSFGLVVFLAALVFGCGPGQTPVPVGQPPEEPAWPTPTPCYAGSAFCRILGQSFPPRSHGPTVTYPVAIAKYNYNEVITQYEPAPCTRTLDGCGYKPVLVPKTHTVINYYIRWQQCEDCGAVDRRATPAEWNGSSAPVINPP
jgi:hypothetical protein